MEESNHRRATDAFIARWARRMAFSLVPILGTGFTFMWRDREEKTTQLNATTQNLGLVVSRVDNLEKRVDDWQVSAAGDRDEIKTELRALRVEVKEMYRRAVAAGGRNP